MSEEQGHHSASLQKQPREQIYCIHKRCGKNIFYQQGIIRMTSELQLRAELPSPIKYNIIIC